MSYYSWIFLIVSNVAFSMGTGDSHTQCSIYKEYHYVPSFNVTPVELGSATSMHECIRACNEDENCTDFVIQRRNSNSDDDDINCIHQQWNRKSIPVLCAEYRIIQEDGQ